MKTLPTGTVTLVFTDIEGSSLLWEKHRADFQAVLEAHNRILRRAAERWRGIEVKTEGDAFFLAFASAGDAVEFAVEAQLALASQAWDAVLSGIETLRVRIGMHTGEPLLGSHPDGSMDYFGPVVNRAARVGAAGHGGQVVVSSATRSVALPSLRAEISLHALGRHPLRGVGEEDLFQVWHEELRRNFPPLKTPEIARHNLPAALTSFVGRELECERVRALLREARLVTLTGPGGTGKSRLAMHAAEGLVDAFADGVFFVPLATLLDPTLLAPAVAQVFNLQQSSNGSPIDSLKSFLRAREILLLLDNFEQIATAAPLLSEILAACPRLRILVTSRVVLRVSGERELSVPPLGLPPRRLPALAEIAECAAVRLFVERAQQARPGFALSAENSAAVASICMRLDGLPLAIELAAARVKMLSPEAILPRLKQSLGFLTGRSRDLPERHGTLRSTIAWSHDLLAEPEKVLFRRLAAFNGGWDLEAAEAVCQTPEPLAVDVLDGLTDLVDQSLVSLQGRDGDSPRFTLLETIREFAVEQLARSGEAAAVSQRHAEQYVRLAEDAEPRLRGPEQATWLERLDLEHDNVRAALARLIAADSALDGLRLAASLWYFWATRGYFNEGIDWLMRALERVPAAPCSGEAPSTAAASVRSKALSAASLITYFKGDYPGMTPLAEEALALAEAASDGPQTAFALAILAVARTHQGDAAGASALNSRAVELARTYAARWLEAFALNTQAIASHMQGRYREASWGASHEVFQSVGDLYWGTYPLIGFGFACQSLGEHERSGPVFRDSLARCRELRNLRGQALSLAGLAGAACAAGRLEESARLQGASEALREAISSPVPAVYRGAHQESLARLRQSLDEAPLQRAWAAGRAEPLEELVGKLLEA